MMAELQLNSLIIQNFRGFENFQINQLGRVNLIVGKNNIGKTSLLEAIWLYANRGSSATIYEILKDRDEHRVFNLNADTEQTQQEILAIKNLFYQRHDFTDQTQTIRIGNTTENYLQLQARWYQVEINDAEHFVPKPIKYADLDFSNEPFFGVEALMHKKDQTIQRIRRYPSYSLSNNQAWIEVPWNFIRSHLVDRYQISVWRNISLIDGLENYIIEGLKIIDSSIEAMNMVNIEENKSINRTPNISLIPIPVVRMQGETKFIPLRSLGDGLNRILILILAMVNAKNGFVLIDEIENGLHYSIYPDVWKLIFKLAETLNVQVFATTHSKECLNAFNKNNKYQTAQSGRLIRLGRKKGKIIATEYNQKDMQVILERDIEVR
ncbi:AAA family ATPase [Herpetosiphon llansteffanensis]|uniref:AAA family ATPase n=1 Tax=Herpetosiphon llansteffanensis TaxID=2094568 RepID=UPI0013E083C7|nr:ATP-binding protein [Herpetosiphon llansteffanensis]